MINSIDQFINTLYYYFASRKRSWIVMQIGIQSFSDGNTNQIVERSFSLILKIDFAIYFSDKMSQMTSRRFKIRTTAFNRCYYSRYIVIFWQPWIFGTLDFRSTLIRFENLVGFTKENTGRAYIRHTIHFRNCTALCNSITTIFHNWLLWKYCPDCDCFIL